MFSRGKGHPEEAFILLEAAEEAGLEYIKPDQAY